MHPQHLSHEVIEVPEALDLRVVRTRAMPQKSRNLSVQSSADIGVDAKNMDSPNKQACGCLVSYSHISFNACFGDKREGRMYHLPRRSAPG